MPFDALPEKLMPDLIKLRIARDGIAGKQGWIKGDLGVGDHHCLIGWLLEATEGNAEEATRLVIDYVYPALPEKFRQGPMVDSIYRFNDRGKTCKADVVRVFNEALRLAEVKHCG